MPDISTAEHSPDIPKSDKTDVVNSPESERETEELQNDQNGSRAFDDAEIARGDVLTLPGTGGPDDTGDIEVDPGEIHLPTNTGITAAAPPKAH